MLELTIISAQELKNSISCFSFSHSLKPFITITTFPMPSSSSTMSSCNSSCHVYSTMVDVVGGCNPTWGDKFLLPLDPTFFTTGRSNYSSCIYLELFTKRALLGPYLLGWVQIPALDIVDGPIPLGLARHLSYRVLKRDGSRGQGVVNVACRFVGELPVIRQPQRSSNIQFTTVNAWQTVTGIPVTALPMRMK